MKSLLILLLLVVVGGDGASIAHKGILKLVWFPPNMPPPKHLSSRQPYIEVPSSRQPKQFLGARYIYKQFLKPL
jgi:hypothetical protein